MARDGIKVIYKVTYPNGKIYVGKDLTNSLTYFGSPKCEDVEKDFTEIERQCFTAEKEILYVSKSTEEINRIEPVFIRELRSNDPAIGYNRWPKR